MLCTEPSPGVAALRSLVDAVDAALCDGGSPFRDTGVVLRVVSDDGGAGDPAGGELGFLPLGGGHPLDALLGLVAPPTWAALGVAAPGDGRMLDDDRPPERVHVTMLLARSGASAGVLRRDGDPPTRLDGSPAGSVADACRRALGLPTAPPAGGTAELWTRWWLDRLVQAATERGACGPVPGWAEAVALHPATFVPLPTPATQGGETSPRRAPTDPAPSHGHRAEGPTPPAATRPDLPPPDDEYRADGAASDQPAGPGHVHPADGAASDQPAGPGHVHPADGAASDQPAGPGHDHPADGAASDQPEGPGHLGPGPALGPAGLRPELGRPPLSLAAPAAEPAVVVAASAALADAWTWARLRAHPYVVDLPGAPVGRRVAQWMDDGMFARWLLSGLPPAGALLDACRALLPEGVAARVAAVTAATLGGEPEAHR